MTLNTPSSVSVGVRPMISRTRAYSSAERPNSAARAWETTRLDSVIAPDIAGGAAGCHPKPRCATPIGMSAVYDTGILNRYQVPRHRLTVRDYHRLAEAGILGEDDRVELLEGQLVDMSAIGPRHALAVDALTE